MADNAFLIELEAKMSQYQAKLEELNDKISKYTLERDSVMHGYDACRILLEMEPVSSEGIKNSLGTNESLSSEKIPNFSELTLPDAADAVLTGLRRPLSNAELVREIRKRGKSMEGPNSYNILYTSLKRNSQRFKKQGSKWTLVNKSVDTKAA